MMPKAPDERADTNPWPEWPKVCKTDYGQQEAIDIYAKMTASVMERIISGQMTFQRAFMTGEMTAKGNFKTLRMLDHIFIFE